MPKVHADPDHLSDFAAILRYTVEQMRDSKSRVTSSFNELHDEWNDKKYTDFEKLFSETMARLERFFESSEIFIRDLTRQAETLESYQRQHYGK